MIAIMLLLILSAESRFLIERDIDLIGQFSCPVDDLVCDQPLSYEETKHFSCNDLCPDGYACCEDSCFVHKICKPSGISGGVEKRKEENCPEETLTCAIPFPPGQYDQLACKEGSCPEGYKCCSDSCFYFKVCKKVESSRNEKGEEANEANQITSNDITVTFLGTTLVPSTVKISNDKVTTEDNGEDIGDISTTTTRRYESTTTIEECPVCNGNCVLKEYVCSLDSDCPPCYLCQFNEDYNINQFCIHVTYKRVSTISTTVDTEYIKTTTDFDDEVLTFDPDLGIDNQGRETEDSSTVMVTVDEHEKSTTEAVTISTKALISSTTTPFTTHRDKISSFSTLLVLNDTTTLITTSTDENNTTAHSFTTTGTSTVNAVPSLAQTEFTNITEMEILPNETSTSVLDLNTTTQLTTVSAGKTSSIELTTPTRLEDSFTGTRKNEAAVTSTVTSTNVTEAEKENDINFSYAVSDVPTISEINIVTHTSESNVTEIVTNTSTLEHITSTIFAGTNTSIASTNINKESLITTTESRPKAENVTSTSDSVIIAEIGTTKINENIEVWNITTTNVEYETEPVISTLAITTANNFTETKNETGFLTTAATVSTTAKEHATSTETSANIANVTATATIEAKADTTSVTSVLESVHNTTETGTSIAVTNIHEEIQTIANITELKSVTELVTSEETRANVANVTATATTEAKADTTTSVTVANVSEEVNNATETDTSIAVTNINEEIQTVTSNITELKPVTELVTSAETRANVANVTATAIIEAKTDTTTSVTVANVLEEVNNATETDTSVAVTNINEEIQTVTSNITELKTVTELVSSAETRANVANVTATTIKEAKADTTTSVTVANVSEEVNNATETGTIIAVTNINEEIQTVTSNITELKPVTELVTSTKTSANITSNVTKDLTDTSTNIALTDSSATVTNNTTKLVVTVAETRTNVTESENFGATTITDTSTIPILTTIAVSKEVPTMLNATDTREQRIFTDSGYDDYNISTTSTTIAPRVVTEIGEINVTVAPTLDLTTSVSESLTVKIKDLDSGEQIKNGTNTSTSPSLEESKNETVSSLLTTVSPGQIKEMTTVYKQLDDKDKLTETVISTTQKSDKSGSTDDEYGSGGDQDGSGGDEELGSGMPILKEYDNELDDAYDDESVKEVDERSIGGDKGVDDLVIEDKILP